MPSWSLAQPLCRIEDGIVRMEKAVLVAATLAMVLLLLLQIATRAGLPLPLDFSEELTRILLPWMIFLGAALATHGGAHFAVHILMQHLHFPGKRALEALVALVALAFMAVVAWVGVRGTLAGSLQVFPSLGISVAFAQWAMPVGFLLMIFHTLMILPRRAQGPAKQEAAVEAAV